MPHKPVGIPALGLALDEEGVAADRELIARRGFANFLARSSKVAVSAWMRVSPKPMTVSGRGAMTRTGSTTSFASPPPYELMEREHIPLPSSGDRPAKYCSDGFATAQEANLTVVSNSLRQCRLHLVCGTQAQRGNGQGGIGCRGGREDS